MSINNILIDSKIETLQNVIILLEDQIKLWEMIKEEES